MTEVLVLNASYAPLRLVSVRRALRLLFQGKAELVEAASALVRAQLSSDALFFTPYSLTDESYPKKSCASGKTGSSASPVLRFVADACAILL